MHFADIHVIGAQVIDPAPHSDERARFMRTWCTPGNLLSRVSSSYRCRQIWGLSRRKGTVTGSATSAMVYLEDSRRAAAIAKVESGLHLNFTIAFTAPEVHLKSIEHQKRLAACLKSIDLPGLSLILHSRTPLSISFHLSATNSKGYSDLGLGGSMDTNTCIFAANIVCKDFCRLEELYGATLRFSMEKSLSRRESKIAQAS